MATCTICDQRKAKRDCPALGEGICPQCCGEQREEKISCPIDCTYLVDSRKFDRPIELPANIPNQDVQVTQAFLQEQHELLEATGESLATGIFESPNVIDRDVRDALQAAIQTLRTAESGLIYQSRPDNLYAAAIQQRLEYGLEQFRSQRQQQSGMFSIRDVDLIGALVFFQRLAFQLDNGRSRGRSFIAMLYWRYVSSPPNAG